MVSYLKSVSSTTYILVLFFKFYCAKLGIMSSTHTLSMICENKFNLDMITTNQPGY